MSRVPPSIERFLHGRNIAVAGVSRQSGQAANAIFRKLRKSGYTVYPINPNSESLEGVRCFPEVAALPKPIDGVVIATHPEVSPELLQQCAAAGLSSVWLHRSFGHGSVSREAVEIAENRGLECIEGGCPMMFCPPVDIAHRCMRWWLGRKGRLPS